MQEPRQVLEPIFRTLVTEMKQKGAMSFSKIMSEMERGFRQSGHRAAQPGRTRRRVLIVRLDQIGDNVLNSAFLREFRRAFPEDEIDLLLRPAVRPLFEFCPYVDHVLRTSFCSSRQADEIFAWIFEVCRDVLWERYYDLCILPRWDVDETLSTVLALACGARERVGFSENVSPFKSKINHGFDRFLTRAIMTPPYLVHEVQKDLYLLTAFGAKAASEATELWLDQASIEAAKQRLQAAGGTPVAVAVSTREGRKTYPPELLAVALRDLLETDAMFFLLGGPEDQEAAAAVRQALPQERVTDLAGRTPLRESAALVALSSFYMGGDTGLTHIAAAAGRPVVEWNAHPLDVATSTYSAYINFYPWQTAAIVLRPERALDDCGVMKRGFGEITGCKSQQGPHCIRAIDPHKLGRVARTLLQQLEEGKKQGHGRS